MQEAIISCRDVWKLYGSNTKKYLKSINKDTSYENIQKDGYITAVRNISIDVFKGEMLVIMGLSGSGKSTLVRCLSRLIDITDGSITIEGQDLCRLNEKELISLRRNKMGMVFQNFALLPHRTVLDNVAFPLEMRGQNRHDRRDRALEVVKLVGLQGREDYYPRELSGGQQQRVGIARSLAIEPDIWFLDEPFSALDPLIRREMQNEFLRLQEMLGKTIVFITHDFDEALRLADRIAIMKDGAIQQIDTPSKILMHPANDYVKKFTKEIEKSRVIVPKDILETDKLSYEDKNPVPANKTIHDLARVILSDEREILPVKDKNEKIIGSIKREKVLQILLGDE